MARVLVKVLKRDLLRLFDPKEASRSLVRGKHLGAWFELNIVTTASLAKSAQACAA